MPQQAAQPAAPTAGAPQNPPGKTYEVDMGGGFVGKVRDPIMVTVLSLITLGIYAIVWWYKINREMRDFGQVNNQQVLAKTNPVLSVLAITLGFLIIVPPFVSLYNTVQRIKTSQTAVGHEEINGWVILGLLVAGLFIPLVGLGIYYYMQQGMNTVLSLYPPLQRTAAVTPSAQ